MTATLISKFKITIICIRCRRYRKTMETISLYFIIKPFCFVQNKSFGHKDKKQFKLRHISNLLLSPLFIPLNSILFPFILTETFVRLFSHWLYAHWLHLNKPITRPQLTFWF